MEIIGKLIALTEETRGESARGPWARGGFVIETEEQFPRKIALSVWGEDRLAMVKSIVVGTIVKVTFNIESREYNGRWYTDCRCTDVGTFTSAIPQNPYGGQSQGYAQPYAQPVQPMGQPQMPQQSNMVQPAQPQMPAQNPQVQYQQPPIVNQPMNGTIENEMPSEDSDDLPF